MAGIGSEDGAAEAGRRRREFIRAHHPDRGGDAETFVAGLRAMEAGRSAGTRRPGWWWSRTGRGP